MKFFCLIICFIFSKLSYSQINTNSPWTWMKGDSSITQYGVYGTQSFTAAPNKPGSRNQGSSWTDHSGNL